MAKYAVFGGNYKNGGRDFPCGGWTDLRVICSDLEQVRQFISPGVTTELQGSVAESLVREWLEPNDSETAESLKLSKSWWEIVDLSTGSLIEKFVINGFGELIDE